MATYTGTSGNDYYVGTSQIDEMFGNGGNDFLGGGSGLDRLAGGDGNDWLISGTFRFFGPGWPFYPWGVKDAFDGEAGDVLSAGDGDDLIWAGLGDTIDGGTGYDELTLDFTNARAAIKVDTLVYAASGTSITGVERIVVTLTEMADAFDARGIDDPAITKLIIRGEGGDDVLTANDHGTYLGGGEGNDLLKSGAGDDSLFGHEGFDIVSYEGALSGVSINLDLQNAPDSDGVAYIDTLGAGLDTLGSIEGVVGSAHADTLSGDSGEPDEGGTLSDLDNFLVGGAGADQLNGGDYNDILISGSVGFLDSQLLVIDPVLAVDVFDDETGDILNGGTGDDLIWAGIGDRIDGGIGYDLLLVDLQNSATPIAIDAESLIDSGTTITGIEVFSLKLSGFADYADLRDIDSTGIDTLVIEGGDGDDTILGGSRSEIILGGMGNNNINAGAGDDRSLFKNYENGETLVDGGEGSDTANFFSHFGTGILSVDLSLEAEQSTGSAGTIRLSSIENIVGSKSRQNHLIGNAEDNLIEGGREYDVLIGGAGDDVLSGDEGGGLYDGGSGDDIISGGTGGNDSVSYESASGAIQVNLSTRTQQNTSASGRDTLINIEHLRGSEFGDTMTGNIVSNTLLGRAGNDVINGMGGNDTLAGEVGNDKLLGGIGNDHLFGGDGNDTLIGGADSDILEGGAGVDIASYETSTQAVTVSLALQAEYGFAGGQNTLGGGLDTLSGIENLTGSAYADTLAGSDANNILAGGAGNDQLIGGDGNDGLTGGAGNDLVDGGDGIDTATYDSSAQAVTVSLALQAEYGFAGTQNTLGAGIDKLAGIENLTGSTHGDTLTGSSAANLLNGGNGNDLLFGNGGGDTLLGGSGDDRLLSGTGNDVLNGGAGIDTVDYSSGALGGGVIVTLGVAAGQDTGAGGADILSGIENLVGTAFNDTLTGSSAANRIEGGIGADLIGGLSGNDTLLGGAGNDRLTGDAGADSLYGGAGADVFRFIATGDSTINVAGQDIIFDFSHAEGDRIGLAAIDASRAAAGDNAFTLVSAFTGGAGQLVSSFDSALGNYLVTGDVNGDSKADIAFRVFSSTALTAADFIL